jgi:preprotein translocase subunit SecD
VAPPPPTTSRPGRYLAALAVLLIVMLLVVLGGYVFQPANWHKGFKVGLGLDLSSGTEVILKAVSAKKGQTPSSSAMNEAVKIMEDRVEGAGFNGASVQPQGSDEIVVSVPGKGAKQVVGLVGTTALLRFRQVLLEAPNYSSSSSSSSSASPSPSPSSSKSSSPKPSASSSPGPKLSTTADGQGDASQVSKPVAKLFDKVNCDNKNWQAQIYGANPSNATANTKTQIVSCYQQNGVWYKYALGTASVTGQMVTSATAALSSSSSWEVNLGFNGTGSKLFADMTSSMYSKYAGSSAEPLNFFATVLDGDIINTAYVSQAITGGAATISPFTESEASNLALSLRYGHLPLTFQKLDIDGVSAQLGSAQLSAGLIAAAIGLGLVVVYSFLYYRGLGIVSVSSLAIATLTSYLSVVLLSKFYGFTLDLAGVAGLIVAIGITADSFVVFFERLRDEVREGKSLRSAVERGWRRARRTILVSDTVSFLAAALLYYFTIGDVQNFAFTLGLTTLIDVLVVFLFTKPMVTLLARTEFYGNGHKLSGLDPARLGARSPWRGSRRPRPAPGAATSQARTTPKEV